MRSLFAVILLVAACGKEAEAPAAKSGDEAGAKAAKSGDEAGAKVAKSGDEAGAKVAKSGDEAVAKAAQGEPAGGAYALAWTYEPEERQRFARTLVVRPGGGVVILGGSNEPGEGGLRLTALGPDGALLWDARHKDQRVSVADIPNGGGFGTKDGGLVVVGHRMDAELARSAWLGVFDAAGALVGELALPGELALWVVPLADDRALVATVDERGAMVHTVHVVALGTRTIESSAPLEGQPEVPEVVGDAFATVVWTQAEERLRATHYTVSRQTGALSPAAAPSESWKAAAGDSVLVGSLPLDGRRLAIVRGHGESATVTLVLTDDSGERLWRHFVLDEGFDQVRVATALSRGFAFVQERWVTDSKGLRDPAGYRVVRMR